MSPATARRKTRAPALSNEDVRAIIDSLATYKYFPVEFCQTVIGMQPDDWQTWTARAVAYQARVIGGYEKPMFGMRRAAVASSTGVGKDAIAACLALWFLVCFKNPKIIITGPSDDQLDDVMWPELAKWINHGPILPMLVEWQNESVLHRGNPTNAFISRRTASVRITQGGERDAEGLSGIHEDNVFIIFDESPGIVDEVWNALLPTMTGPNNVALALGNPTRTSGMFFRIWYDLGEAKFWQKIRVSSEPWPKILNGRELKDQPDFISERASEEERARLRAMPDSSPVKIAKLYGRHPIGIADNVVFSYDEVTEAIQRPLYPFTASDEVQIGVDVARLGDDRTVFTVRRGYNITRMIVKDKTLATYVKDMIKVMVEEEGALTYWLRQKYPRDQEECEIEYARLPQIERARYYPKVVIDMGGGYGSTIYDELYADGYTNMDGVDFGSTAQSDEVFQDRASEMWAGTVKDMIGVLSLSALPLDVADVLRRQLTTRPYDTDSLSPAKRERIKILSKKEMRRRGLESPDHADSLCLSAAYVVPPGVY